MLTIHVLVQTYRQFGDHKTLSLIGDFFVMNQTNFGSTITEIEITIHFRNGGAPKKRQAVFWDQFEEELKQLPWSRFYRKKRRIQHKYLSNLGDSCLVEDSQPPDLELFTQGCQEVAEELKKLMRKIKRTDDFDPDRFICHIQAKIDAVPDSQTEFARLQAEIERDAKIRLNAMDEWDKLGIDWDDYHPKARKILDDPFFWSLSNEFAPNGNDTGADLLSHYREWRSKNKDMPCMKFFQRLMKEWIVKIPPTLDDLFSYTTYFESAVATAFAQIKVDGKCEIDINNQAQEAITNYRRSIEGNRKEWDLFTERIRTLELLEQKLKQVG